MLRLDGERALDPGVDRNGQIRPQRVQGVQQAVEWLEEMQRRVADRKARVHTRVNGPAYAGLDATRKALEESGFARATTLEEPENS